MIDIFFKTFFLCSGATFGIIAILAPIVIISYLAYTLRLKLILFKMRKRQEKALLDEYERVNQELEGNFP